jgi:hypothetical protein
MHSDGEPEEGGVAAINMGVCAGESLNGRNPGRGDVGLPGDRPAVPFTPSTVITRAHALRP